MKTMTSRKSVSIIAIILLIGQLAFAQGMPGNKQRQKQRGQITENLFPLKLVMRYQKAIDLTPEQRDYIIETEQNTKKEFTELQWTLQKEMETFEEIISKSTVDKNKALEQSEKVLKLENSIKRKQLSFLITIKNKLTPEQQELLQKLK